MFTIIGGDGKEYGPVTAAQVRSWIAAGRANLATQARVVGTEEWRTLGDYAEFTSFGEAPPVIDPTRPGSTPAGRGMRLVARVIDWIIELVCSIPGLLFLGPEFTEVMRTVLQGHEPDLQQLDPSRIALGGLLLLAGWLLLLVVQVWLLSVRGQTLGKLITRIRVVRLDESKAGFVHAWLMREALITAIGIVLGLIPFVGPVMLRPVFHITDWCFVFRADQRCLHDQIAGTKVIKL